MGCYSIEICREIERNRDSFRETELDSSNRIHSSSNRICGQVLFINFLSFIFTLYYFTLIEMILVDFERWKVYLFPLLYCIFFHSNPCPRLTLTTTLSIHTPPLTLAVISVGVPYLYVSVSKRHL